MAERGWDAKMVNDTIANPVKTKSVRVTWHIEDGSCARFNDPATTYFRSDSSHVVRNDKTVYILSSRLNHKLDSGYTPDL